MRFAPGACDCHAHVFGPQDRFPFLPHATYIPPDALPGDYARMLTSIGCQRAVLVQPSVYGTDNSCMVAAMDSGVFNFRGVAVIEEEIGDKELEALHRAGVRGVRINVASRTAGLTMEQAPRLAARIKALGWHLQFFLRLDQCPAFEQQISGLPVPCVIDHFAHVHAAGRVESEGFQALLRLARLEHVWFKLIGPYRISTGWPLYPDVAPLARALVAAAPDRCVWGTDWPHPNARTCRTMATSRTRSASGYPMRPCGRPCWWIIPRDCTGAGKAGRAGRPGKAHRHPEAESLRSRPRESEESVTGERGWGPASSKE